MSGGKVSGGKMSGGKVSYIQNIRPIPGVKTSQPKMH